MAAFCRRGAPLPRRTGSYRPLARPPVDNAPVPAINRRRSTVPRPCRPADHRYRPVTPGHPLAVSAQPSTPDEHVLTAHCPSLRPRERGGLQPHQPGLRHLRRQALLRPPRRPVLHPLHTISARHVTTSR
ncbi:hypothetical protein QJS66_08985 [Kocuria rhizophila]|nr:hypothetical protein QJS66_08985 [Kocuria rhizophila]